MGSESLPFIKWRLSEFSFNLIFIISNGVGLPRSTPISVSPGEADMRVIYQLYMGKLYCML